MKTKILMITALIFGGLLFTSCQKDNALADDVSADLTKSGPWSDANDQGDTFDPIANYPDPFHAGTTIYYKLKSDAWVTLNVLDEDLVWVGELVREFQVAGDYAVKFDGSNLKAGKYIARLKAGSKIYNETMTKKPLFQEAKSPIDIQVGTN
jgi:hypothetical protein